MTLTRSILAGAAIAAAVIGSIFALSGFAQGSSEKAMARRTALEFFQSLDARRYGRTCDLLAAEFYRKNHVRNKALCALALRIEYTWAPTYRFRIVGVHVDGRRAVVDALANGAPGHVDLVREADGFKVVSVRGR